MEPSAEQLVRDYLSRLSVAARTGLRSDDRRAFLARMRIYIERNSGPPGTADPGVVARTLSSLGDPGQAVERERARLAAARQERAASATRSGLWRPRRRGSAPDEDSQPDEKDAQPAASSAPGATAPQISGRPLTGEYAKKVNRPVSSRWRPGEPMKQMSRPPRSPWRAAGGSQPPHPAPARASGAEAAPKPANPGPARPTPAGGKPSASGPAGPKPVEPVPGGAVSGGSKIAGPVHDGPKIAGSAPDESKPAGSVPAGRAWPLPVARGPSRTTRSDGPPSALSNGTPPAVDPAQVATPDTAASGDGLPGVPLDTGPAGDAAPGAGPAVAEPDGRVPTRPMPVVRPADAPPADTSPTTAPPADAPPTTVRPAIVRRRRPRRPQPADLQGLGRQVAYLWRQNRLEGVAVTLLALAGLIYPWPLWLLGFAMWLAGVAVAVPSRLWGLWDKWAGLVGPLALVIVGTPVSLVLGGARHPMSAYAHEAMANATFLIKVGVLLGAGYLAWRIYRGPRAPSLPPWNRPHRI